MSTCNVSCDLPVNNDLCRGGAEICIDADLVSYSVLFVCVYVCMCRSVGVTLLSLFVSSLLDTW